MYKNKQLEKQEFDYSYKRWMNVILTDLTKQQLKQGGT